MKEPTLTEFEEIVFRRYFVEKHSPGYHFSAIQIEGDGRLAVVSAGLRLERKGVVQRIRSCNWTLTDLGVAMAEKREKRPRFKQIEEKLRDLKSDERMTCPPATVFANAPLALIQTDLYGRIRTLEWVLGYPACSFPRPKKGKRRRSLK